MSDYDVDATPVVAVHPLIAQLEMGNLVEQMKQSDDGKKATERVMGLYADAEQSMADWLKEYKAALWLAKLKPFSEGTLIKEKNFPFPKASMAMLPFIMEAMLDFHSRAAPELVWARNIVKAKVYGDNSVTTTEQGTPTEQGKSDKIQAKESRAKRVSTYTNYQLREEIPAWREEQDKMLLTLPCVGTAYKEGSWDSDEKIIRSDLHLADAIIFDHNCKSFDLAPDKFIKLKLSRNDVIAYIRGEQKWDVEEEGLDKEKTEFEFIKCYSWVDLDDDGIREPYILIINPESNKTVYLEPNYDTDTVTLNGQGDLVKIKPNKRFTQYQFLPDPSGGPMGMGWGILLGETFSSLNTIFRQMIDAATVQITASNSGIIELDSTTGRGNSIAEGPIQMVLGQLTPVRTRGGRPMKDNVYQFQAAGPSESLFNLMQYMVESLRKMTTASSQVDTHTNEAATLYLARLQQALKVPNMIIMRVYQAAEKEFKVIFALDYKFFSHKAYNKVLDNDTEADMEADFNPDDCDIRLTADPSQGSDIERNARAEAILQEAKTQPSPIIDLRGAYINWLETMGTPNVEKLTPIPPPDPMQKAYLMQQQAEMEIKREEVDARKGELEVKRAKNALQAARDMAELGQADEKMVAETTLLYATALEKMVKSGLTPERSLQLIRGEDNYIG